MPLSQLESNFVHVGEKLSRVPELSQMFRDGLFEVVYFKVIQIVGNFEYLSIDNSVHSALSEGYLRECYAVAPFY